MTHFLIALLATLPPEVQEKPQQSVEKLIRKLRDDQPAIRQRAEAALEALGPEALPRLRRAMTSNDLDLASRASALISRIEHNQRVKDVIRPEKRISINIPRGKLSDALELLRKQTGYKITTMQSNGLANTENALIPEVSATDVPFLEALEAVLGESPLVLKSVTRTGEVLLEADSGITVRASQARGPLLLQLREDRDQPNLPYDITIFISPSFSGRSVVAQLELLKATDENGEALPGVQFPDNAPFVLVPGVSSDTTLMTAKPNRIKRLRVRATLLTVLDSQRIRLQPNTGNGKEIERRIGKLQFRYCLWSVVDASIKSATYGQSGTAGVIDVKALDDSAMTHSIILLLRNSAFRCYGTDGKTFSNASTGGAYEGKYYRWNEVSLTQSIIGIRRWEIDRMEISLPTDAHTQTFEFELRDIRLIDDK